MARQRRKQKKQPSGALASQRLVHGAPHEEREKGGRDYFGNSTHHNKSQFQANLAKIPATRKTEKVNGVKAKEQHRERQHGLPHALKAGLEELSGMDMGDVRVYYNSRKPKQLNALAYTQSPNIYVGSGQEAHLPHEGWHVVQQKEGRVKPTAQENGIFINNEMILEREADVMGGKAFTEGKKISKRHAERAAQQNKRPSKVGPAQCDVAVQRKLVSTSGKPILEEIKKKAQEETNPFVSMMFEEIQNHPTEVHVESYEALVQDLLAGKYNNLLTSPEKTGTLGGEFNGFLPLSSITHKTLRSRKSSSKRRKNHSAKSGKLDRDAVRKGKEEMEEPEELSLSDSGDIETDSDNGNGGWARLVKPKDETDDAKLVAYKKTVEKFWKGYNMVAPGEVGEETLKAYLKRNQVESRKSTQVKYDVVSDVPVEVRPETVDQGLEPNTDEASHVNWSKAVKVAAKSLLDKLGSREDTASQVAYGAVIIARKELLSIGGGDISVRQALAQIGTGGVAGFLEEQVTKEIAARLPQTLAEMAPKGKVRKAIAGGMRIIEGGIDVVFNTAGLATQAITATLSTFGSAGIGGAYKGVFEYNRWVRRGSTSEKAGTMALVVAVLETLQGLIPFVGGAWGVASGAKAITWDTWKVAKHAKRYLKGQTYKPIPPGGDRMVISVLDSRIEHCERLIKMGEALQQSKQTTKALGKLQLAKSDLVVRKKKVMKLFKADDKGIKSGKAPLIMTAE